MWRVDSYGETLAQSQILWSRRNARSHTSTVCTLAARLTTIGFGRSAHDPLATMAS